MTTAQANGNGLMVQGRLVWTSGSTIFEGKKKTDFNTGVPLLDETGQPLVEYGFGLAIPKYDPRTNQPTEVFSQVWKALHQEAYSLYPTGQLPPDFAMKYKDGDAVDHNGKSFAEREGYKGHIVLACTTQIPLKCFRFEGGNNILVNDGIKCGDYVNVQLNIKAHPPKGRGKAGLYLNPSAVQLIQAGKEIINTPSGDQLFGQAAPSYAGEVVAHVAPTMPNVAYGQAPAMTPPMNAPMPGYAPQAPAQPAYAPQTAPVAQPHYGVVPQTFQPGQQQAPAMTPPMNAPMPGYAPQAPTQPAYAPQTGAPSMPNMPGMPR